MLPDIAEKNATDAGNAEVLSTAWGVAMISPDDCPHKSPDPNPHPINGKDDLPPSHAFASSYNSLKLIAMYSAS